MPLLRLSVVAVVLLVIAASSFTEAAGTQKSYVSTDGTYYFTTENTNAYMCSTAQIAASGSPTVCGIAQYPAGANEGASTTLTCPTGRIISCFLFASHGEVGGSCTAGSSEGLKENPMLNSYLNVANSVLGTACLNKNSCTLTIGVDSSSKGTINGVSTTLDDLMGAGSKVKVRAICSTGTSTTPTPTATPTPTPVPTSGAAAMGVTFAAVVAALVALMTIVF